MRVRDGAVERRRLRHLRAAPVLRGVAARARATPSRPTSPPAICGICPVAYQMSACAAIEDACGVEVAEPIRALRRLLYCGEWIESHALHIYLLHAPDFLGYDGAIEMARDHRGPRRARAAAQEGGQRADGRARRPRRSTRSTSASAASTALPTRPTLARLLPEARAGPRRCAGRPCAGSPGFDFPDFEATTSCWRCAPADAYPIETGAIVASDGRTSRPADVRPSTSSRSRSSTRPRCTPGCVGRRGRTSTGPLARYALNARPALAARARGGGATPGLGPDVPQPVPQSSSCAPSRSLHACDEALRLIERLRRRPAAAVDGRRRGAGVGHGVTEAPRGLLYHRYDARRRRARSLDGAHRAADVAEPAAASRPTCAAFVQAHARPGRRRSCGLGCEQAIRNHDPCISCATHFLRVSVDAGPGRP